MRFQEGTDTVHPRLPHLICERHAGCHSLPVITGMKIVRFHKFKPVPQCKPPGERRFPQPFTPMLYRPDIHFLFGAKRGGGW